MKPAELQYIVNNKGERSAVILSIDEYDELLQDIHDLSVIAERREEPTVSFDTLKEELRKDGLL